MTDEQSLARHHPAGQGRDTDMLARRALAAALVAAAAAALTGPVPAYAEDGAFVVTASRSGYADVAVPEPFTAGSLERSDVVTKGSYAGFWAVRLDDPTAAAAPLQVDQVDSIGVLFVRRGREFAVVTTSGRGQLPANDSSKPTAVYPAGTYRFHVFSDAPVRLRYPLGGTTKTVAVKPAKATRSWAGRRAVPPLAAYTPATTNQPFTTTARSGVWHGFYYDADVEGYAAATCVGAPGQPCSTWPHVISMYNAPRGNGLKLSFVQPSLGPGSWENRLTVTPFAEFTKVTLLTIVFEAP